MQAHEIPLYALKKARKNGTWKLVQKGLLDLLKSGTPIYLNDDQGKRLAEFTTERDFANWWNQNMR
ncbi:MAG: hypothetical protein OEZ58_15610 [Gammaproteobacteria bacterium]|nr:hypothetical protein [Gammaproteobacteria bacterium]